MNSTYTRPVAIALIALVTSLFRVLAQDSTSETVWQQHLLKQSRAGLGLLAVTWQPTNEGGLRRVRFSAQLETEVARYEKRPFFAEDCPAGVAQLRAKLVELGRPVEYLHELHPAGAVISVAGSFLLRLDGSFGKISYDPGTRLGEPAEAGQPLEDSEYSKVLRTEIAQLKADNRRQIAGQVLDLLDTAATGVGKLTGHRGATVATEVITELKGFANPQARTVVPAITNAALPVEPTPAAQPALDKLDKGLRKGLGAAVNLLGGR